MKKVVLTLSFLLSSCDNSIEPTGQIFGSFRLSVETVCGVIDGHRIQLSELSTSRFVEERYFYVVRSLAPGKTQTLIGGFDDNCFRTLPFRPERATSIGGVISLMSPLSPFSSFPDVENWFEANWRQLPSSTEDLLVYSSVGDGADRVEYWLVFEPFGFVVGNALGEAIGLVEVLEE